MMMQQVSSIELAGRGFYVEKDGAQILEEWLNTAKETLSGDPDCEELLIDFERSIAGKLEDNAPDVRDVVSTKVVKDLLEAIGPVEPATPSAGSAAEPKKQESSAKDDWRSRKLYKLTGEDAMLTGVCAGVAAYLKVDVTIVRLVFVILALVTSGLWAVCYIAMAIFMPEADTSEKRAAARGYGDTANELIAKARGNAGPILEKSGETISSIWHVIAVIFYVLALLVFILSLAATSVVVILALAGVSGVVSPLGVDIPVWVVALFYTCAGWVFAAPVLWMAMLSRVLDPKNKKQVVGKWHVMLAATWVVSIAGIAIIYAVYSSAISDIWWVDQILTWA